MDAPFLGREHELAVLQELATSGRPELFVLYGRRRVGKTELLQQLCRGRRAVYFLAAQVRDKDNLRAFRQAVRDGLDDALVETVEFADWGAALGYCAERSKEERLVVVLDEFPYLCEADKGLPSVVQRFWDQRGKHADLMLVLCGSQVSFMEREVLAERSPLFGRRTGQRRLTPLAPPDTLGFFPEWPLRERLVAYGILGGMPAYLRRFDPARSLAENVSREILRPEGFLFDEVQFLLRTELSSPATYNSLLAAIARGADRVGDIALMVGVDSTTANRYLSTLRELGLVERVVPLTDPDPLRSRRGTYRISDRFIAFHFRHVQPNVSLIEAGRGGRVLEEFVLPDFERLYEEARTELLLDHLRRHGAETVGDEIAETGRGNGIRALARTLDGRGVIARYAGDAEPSEAILADPRAVFGPELIQVVYRLTDDPARPLSVERAD
jgi:AAA+ ATPase superfamily predicted ATPase